MQFYYIIRYFKHNNILVSNFQVFSQLGTLTKISHPNLLDEVHCVGAPIPGGAADEKNTEKKTKFSYICFFSNLMVM